MCKVEQVNLWELPFQHIYNGAASYTAWKNHMRLYSKLLAHNKSPITGYLLKMEKSKNPILLLMAINKNLTQTSLSRKWLVLGQETKQRLWPWVTGSRDFAHPLSTHHSCFILRHSSGVHALSCNWQLMERELCPRGGLWGIQLWLINSGLVPVTEEGWSDLGHLSIYWVGMGGPVTSRSMEKELLADKTQTCSSLSEQSLTYTEIGFFN